MRKVVLWLGLVIILAAVNSLIIGKQHTLANGRVMLLDLAPRDPRSLLQGDYMALRYRLTQAIESITASSTDVDGDAVVRLDKNQVAEFVRLHNTNEPLHEGDYLLHYRMRGGAVKIATDAFFFQEGQAATYNNARYGRFRVSTKGEAVLTGVCDADFQWLSQPATTPAQTVSCQDEKI
ncbi:MAG: GDYXXLXY domain-containing protein [Gammaproteobacteria bacterium]|nr:GDYXXLXY domain-containing protein [Gammaproteobacteria bacterium]